MSKLIDFNDNWSCSSQPTKDNDEMFVLAGTNAIESFNWSSIVLPDENSSEQSMKCWYRKQFQLNLTNEQTEKSIELVFRQVSNSDGILSSKPILIWFNAVQIFSGTSQQSEISVELPIEVFLSNQTKNPDEKHTLIICSLHTRLSCHLSLRLPANLIENLKETPTNKTNDCSTFVSSIDHLDEQLDTISELKTSKKTKRETNLTLDHRTKPSVPLLSIVILIVGTRGDVQPFIAYGKALKAVGHRVRLATHEKFRKFVREHGLEFYPLASDPAEIMSFMVENSGILPSLSSVLTGQIFKRRLIFLDIMKSTWLACTNDDDETGAPFRADAIIANPISYGHVHCAQKLGVPLHMVFTMPYSPTSAFPHPLGNVDYSKPARERLNKFSYTLVETLMWLGIGDLINKFRNEILDLPSLNIRQATSIMSDQKIPHTYCWSPSLVPKPSDWDDFIDVSGFFFLDLASNYLSPPDDLVKFLSLDSPPIYIGLGSITGHDSHRLLGIILEALNRTGYRALLAGFDIEEETLPKTIMKIGEIPHDWLFQHVAAVCHHGGAGTTATGLRAGKPTIVIPFFGDQFFWGNVIAKKGAGPAPMPGKSVTVDELVAAFQFVHKPSVQEAAQHLKQAIDKEDGCTAAVRAFHENLPKTRLQSDLEPTYSACFRLEDYKLQVSLPVAQVLLSAGLVTESQFRHHLTRDWCLSHDYISEIPRANDFHLDSSIHQGSKSNRRNRFGNKIRNFRRQIRTLQTTTTKSLKNNDEVVQRTNGFPISFTTNFNDLHDDFSETSRQAANISGFSPDICRKIIDEFIKLKIELEEKSQLSEKRKFRMYSSKLRRSLSLDDL